jgi:hypothetical protein
MCGLIAGFHIGANSKEPVNEFIINQYEDQYTRGQKGYGIVRITPGEPVAIDRATEGVKMMMDLYAKDSPMIMFHHRQPTSTENWMDQTHPIKVENGSLAHNYLVIHNGVISNDRDKRKEHLELGFTYTTEYTETSWKGDTGILKFNDSECLAIELARFIEGQGETIDIRGSAAFIALQCTKGWVPTKVFFGRNEGNPLKMAKTQTKMYLSSEGPGNDITPFQLYSAGITDPKMELTKRAFKMAEPIHTTYHYPRSSFDYGTPRTYTPDISGKNAKVETKSTPAKEDHYGYGAKVYDNNDYLLYGGDDDKPEHVEYANIMDTVETFFDEIDSYQSVPDVEWYITQIREQFEALAEEAEKLLADKMAQAEQAEDHKEQLALPMGF